MSAAVVEPPRIDSARPRYWSVTPEAIEQFHEDGFYIVPELFTPEEADLLHKVAKADPNGRPGSDGQQPGMWLFADTDKQDIWNGVVHSRRMVEAMQAFLGDEVYVYHYKMAMKEVANSDSTDGGTVLKDGTRGSPGRKSNNWEVSADIHLNVLNNSYDRMYL